MHAFFPIFWATWKKNIGRLGEGKIGSGITMTTPSRVHASYSIDRNLGSLSIQFDRTGRFLIGESVITEQLEKPTGAVSIRFGKEGNTVGGKIVMK